MGDLLTAVYLPSAPEKTIRLYGFLDLKPNLGIVARDDVKGESVWMTLFGMVFLVLFFALLTWNVYALDRFDPIESNPWQWLPCILGAVVMGGGLLGLIAAVRKDSREKTMQRNQNALQTGDPVEVPMPNEGVLGSGGWLMFLILLFGGIGLGATTFGVLGCTMNAMLDRSKPELVPVTIISREVENHMYLFRMNRVRYQFAEDAADPLKVQSLAMSKEPFSKLELHGMAEVKKGAFGWPWVATIHPAAPPARFP